MTTTELIDELVKLHNGWNRDGDHGILNYVNMANRILASVDAEQNILYDGITGDLPVIDTVAGTMLYVMPATARRVAAVVVKTEDLKYSNDYSNQPRSSYPNGMLVGGIQYSKIPYVKTTDRINVLLLSTVRFTLDPGTQTNYYRRVSYKVPTEILSESIQHDIPEPSDMLYLLPAVSMLIDGVQNYTIAEAMRYVKESLAVQYSKEVSSGDQGCWDDEPVDRGF